MKNKKNKRNCNCKFIPNSLETHNTKIIINNRPKRLKFTNQQLFDLEIEYSRYSIYKNFVVKIDKFIEPDRNIHFYKKKLYENKNILDRFILECINYGLNINVNNQSAQSLKIQNEIDYSIMSQYIFFNKNLTDINSLRNTDYFTKMLSEYAEKKIKFTPNKIADIENTIIGLQCEFTSKIDYLYNNYINIIPTAKCVNKPLDKPLDRPIATLNIGNEYVKIIYRDYEKIISAKRYNNLLKNYDKPTEFDIIKMILRYAIFDNSNQQWSIGVDLYNNVNAIFDVCFEMFASPLNFNMNRFCSIFYDTDKIFGSVGNFYDLNVDVILNKNIKGVFYNPPYLPILMEKTSNICLQLMDDLFIENYEFTVISFLPNWNDADYINKLITSNYVVDYHVLKRGEFVLNEKDKGKLIKGTFDLLVILLNNKISSMKVTDKDLLNCKFTDIINMMKEEANSNLIKFD